MRYRLVGSRGASDGKHPPRAAVLSRLFLGKKPPLPPRRTCEVLSRSCRRILDTTRLGDVLSGPPHSPLPPPIWGICNALCNTVRFKETSKQVFACILQASLVLRASGWLDQQNTRECIRVFYPPDFTWYFSLGYSYLHKRNQCIIDIIVKYKISCRNILLPYTPF